MQGICLQRAEELLRAALAAGATQHAAGGGAATSERQAEGVEPELSAALAAERNSRRVAEMRQLRVTLRSVQLKVAFLVCLLPACRSPALSAGQRCARWRRAQLLETPGAVMLPADEPTAMSPPR